jgi:hypothetical protein
MKKLLNLVWTPSWTSIVGCLHGCLKYLKVDPGFSWLFGGTGHAFIINMSQDGSCPSGPTAWITTPFFNLGRNLGYQVESVFGDIRQPNWEEKQAEAWLLTRTALDNDLPVFGWELAIPEFYVIEGYDEVGYYYNGPGDENGPSPKPWNELGVSGIGMLEIFSVKPGQPSSDKQTIVEALEFALAFNQGSPEWVLPDYRAGPDAYRVWIKAVKSGQATLMGHAYNAAVWEECRRNGVSFLQEAKKRLQGSADRAFNGAIRAYAETAKQLKDITELYPFFENNQEDPLGDDPRAEKAAEHLQDAQAAEEEGLAFLYEIVEGLS